MRSEILTAKHIACTSTKSASIIAIVKETYEIEKTMNATLVLSKQNKTTTAAATETTPPTTTTMICLV